MAKHGDLLIVEDSGQNPTSGGIFALDRTSPVDASIDVGDDWTVEVKFGSSDVLARGGVAKDYDDSRASSLSYAQRGLDLLSVEGTVDLTIVRADDEHETWWLTPQGIALRFVHIRTTFDLEVPQISVSATDSAGNLVSTASPPPTSWHRSFRYYRLAQATDDLFDAYRNLYLALESILDTIEPMQMKPTGKPGESETAWLLRALDVVGGTIDLDGYAPSGKGTAAERIVDEAYQTVRTAIFHARGSRRTLLPGEATIREQVDSARKRLVRLYLVLAREHLQLRRQMAGFYSIGFHRFVAGALDTDEGRLNIYLGDASEVLQENQRLDNSDRPFVPLTTRREPDLDGPFIKSFFGEGSVADLASLPNIRQIVIANRNNEPTFSLIYDQPLTITGLSRVEVHIGLRARNVKLPKDNYSM